MKRVIAHLDMDAFFAAIEEGDKPRLRGKPIVVGADPEDGHGRGVVSTANYPARTYGIHSAMPISQAWRLAREAERAGKPPAVFIGVNGQRYEEVSGHIMGIVRRHVPLVEAASIDEAYLDLSFIGSYKAAEMLCRMIKKEIHEREHLIASIGIGPKTQALFAQHGVTTVGDVKRFSHEELVELLGVWGRDLYERARGRDDTPVIEEYEIKSIGEQETFMRDTSDPNLLTGRLAALAADVMQRFDQSDFGTFQRIVLTVRFTDFETVSRSRTLTEPAASLETLQFEAFSLLMPFFDHRENPRRKAIRLIGIRVEKLAKRI